VDGNDPETEFWIGSADMMHRNLDRRVEALVLVTDPVGRAELDSVLTDSMSDDIDTFVLQGDGSWVRRKSTLDRPLEHVQSRLLRRFVGTAG
jgi:polyphosphate kinase